MVTWSRLLNIVVPGWTLRFGSVSSNDMGPSGRGFRHIGPPGTLSSIYGSLPCASRPRVFQHEFMPYYAVHGNPLSVAAYFGSDPVMLWGRVAVVGSCRFPIAHAAFHCDGGRWVAAHKGPGCRGYSVVAAVRCGGDDRVELHMVLGRVAVVW